MSKSTDRSSNQSSAAPQQAERIMRAYMAEISHEIRTPASAILGLSKLLLTDECGALNEKQREIVAEINKQEGHLLGAFEEFLAMHRLTSGLPELDIAEVNPGELFDGAIADVWEHWLMRDKSTRPDIIRQDIPGTLPRIWVDSSQLQQAITGMLVEVISAVYNDEGSEIVLTASYDDVWITLQVIVTGEGLYSHLQHDRPRMFFCQSVVEMHSGRMSLAMQKESEVQVMLILPIKQPVHG